MTGHLLPTVICRRKSWRLVITKPPSLPTLNIDAKDSRCEPGALHRCSRTLANQALRSHRWKNRCIVYLSRNSGKRVNRIWQTIILSNNPRIYSSIVAENPSEWMYFLFFIIFSTACVVLFTCCRDGLWFLHVRKVLRASMAGSPIFETPLELIPYHIWRQE